MEGCQSSVNKEENIAVECGDYGTCVDYGTDNTITNIIIKLIEELVGKILDIELPGCFCKGQNMNSVCTECKP